ncbi:MAG: hypothetical protein RI911_865, partial [Candidatus Parcubacteria bacterium]
SIDGLLQRVRGNASSLCVFQKNDAQSLPDRTVYELVPTGSLQQEFERAQDLPEDPCGPYGISAAGQRVFEVWKEHEDSVIFLNYGQDGSLFEYDTLTFI